MYIAIDYKGRKGEAWVVFDVTPASVTARIAAVDVDGTDVYEGGDNKPTLVLRETNAKVDNAIAAFGSVGVRHRWVVAVCECGDDCCSVAYGPDRCIVEWGGEYNGPDAYRDEARRLWRAIRACYTHVK